MPKENLPLLDSVEYCVRSMLYAVVNSGFEGDLLGFVAGKLKGAYPDYELGEMAMRIARPVFWGLVSSNGETPISLEQNIVFLTGVVDSRYTLNLNPVNVDCEVRILTYQVFSKYRTLFEELAKKVPIRTPTQ